MNKKVIKPIHNFNLSFNNSFNTSISKPPQPALTHNKSKLLV